MTRSDSERMLEGEEAVAKRLSHMRWPGCCAVQPRRGWNKVRFTVGWLGGMVRPELYGKSHLILRQYR
jgi:hypothetical protein